MNCLGPGENSSGTVYRRHRGAEGIVYSRAFLFGWRWECEEGEFRSSVNLEDDGWHGIVTGIGSERATKLHVSGA